VIRYLKHQEINKPQWDECISHSANGLIYAYSWYLDIVCPGWEALVEDDYTAVMPLPMGKKYGFTYTFPPCFTQQLGVFWVNRITEQRTMDFISAIPSHYRYIEMNLNEKNVITSGNMETNNHLTYVLDLNRPYAELYSKYSTQTKRNLKKALSCSLTIVQAARPEKVIKLFSENRGMEHELPTSFYTIIGQLMEVLLSKGLVSVMGVNDKQNVLCAGAFFLKSKNRDIFLFSGANENAYNSHAMTLLLNNYIEENAGKPILFDFEGSMDTDLARFYSGFGSVKTEFPLIRKSTLPAPVKWIKEIQFRRKSLAGK
jgi:hypothetical protein